MTFVRKKLVKGRPYFYLVKSQWKDGRIRQANLAYLGQFPTVKDAYSHWVREAKKTDDKKAQKHAQEMAKKLKKFL